MALMKPIPSDKTKKALISGVADYLGSSDPLAKVLVQSTMALHVFTLGLADVPSGIDNAKSAGWRFLALDPSGEPIAGDVVEPEGQDPRMTGISLDPIIGRAVTAVREVAAMPGVQEKEYELRVLRIPGVLVEAFWLKTLNGSEDMMIPVLTSSTRLERMRSYPSGQFFENIKQMIPEFTAITEPPTSSKKSEAPKLSGIKAKKQKAAKPKTKR